MQKVQRLTLEQALKFEDRTEVPEWHSEESFIDRATFSYNASIDRYNNELLHANQLLDKKLEETKEKRTDVTIKTETVEEYIYSSGEYLRFAAWSNKYMYILAKYDSEIWMEALPLTASEPIAPIGGIK